MAVALARAPTLDHYWEDGPEFTGEGMTFTTPASVDNDYAATLIQAAFHRTALPHY